MRAVFVSGHLWGKADQPSPLLPDLTLWGWCIKDDQLVPLWTRVASTTDVYKAVRKKCGCGKKNSCLKNNCGCRETKCLPTCACRGECRKDKPSDDEAIMNKLLYDQEIVISSVFEQFNHYYMD